MHLFDKAIYQLASGHGDCGIGLFNASYKCHEVDHFFFYLFFFFIFFFFAFVITNLAVERDWENGLAAEAKKKGGHRCYE